METTTNQKLLPVIVTKPARAIKLRMFEECIVADLTPDLFLSYCRELSIIRIVKNTVTLKTLVCREGYTLNEFMDECIKYKRLLNYYA